MRYPNIIIAGFARTGTSIMFKCLQNSGYNTNEEALKGRRIRAEDNYFAFGCKQIAQKRGAKGLMGLAEKDIGIDILTGEYDKDMLDDEEYEEWTESYTTPILTYFKIFKIELLKHHMLAYSLPIWIRESTAFRKAKYIWTTRDHKEMAKSVIRMKSYDYKPFINKLRFNKILKAIDAYEIELERVLPKDQFIKVPLEDLQALDEGLINKIEGFIERPFNTAFISKKDTWDGRKQGVTLGDYFEEFE